MAKLIDQLRADITGAEGADKAWLLRPYIDRVILTFRPGRHLNSPRLVGLKLMAKPPFEDKGKTFTESDCQEATERCNRNRPEDKRRWWADPDNRRRVAESLGRFWERNAAARKHHSERMKEVASPEVRQGRSDHLRNRWADPEHRERLTDGLRRGWQQRKGQEPLDSGQVT
jgi:hypothetical protein